MNETGFFRECQVGNGESVGQGSGEGLQTYGVRSDETGLLRSSTNI